MTEFCPPTDLPQIIGRPNGAMHRDVPYPQPTPAYPAVPAETQRLVDTSARLPTTVVESERATETAADDVEVEIVKPDDVAPSDPAQKVKAVEEGAIDTPRTPDNTDDIADIPEIPASPPPQTEASPPTDYENGGADDVAPEHQEASEELLPEDPRPAEAEIPRTAEQAADNAAAELTSGDDKDIPKSPQPVSYTKLVDLLDTQGVRLGEKLVEQSGHGEMKGIPTFVLSLVKTAGRLLQTEPGERLTTATEPIVLPDECVGDVPARTLVDMINSQLVPPNPDDFAASFEDTGPRIHPGDCAFIDSRLAGELTRIQQVREAVSDDRFGQVVPADILGDSKIVIDDDDEPVALAFEGPMFLVLQPILVDGIPVPRGYLIGAQTGTSASVVSVHDITNIGLRRLSAYALPPDQRNEFVYLDNRDPAADKVFYEFTIDDITDEVKRVLRACTLAA